MTNPLGLHSGFTRNLSLPERLSILRDAGFDATALWWEHQREDIRAIRHHAPEMVQSAGLVLDHLHAPYFACNDLWSANDSDRHAALTLHQSWIDDCQRHAVPRLVMHVTLGRTPPPPTPHALDTFRRLSAHADDTGITLAIENTHSPAHLDFLFREIPSPALTLCYDIAHDRLHSPHPRALLRAWAQRLSVLHISDNNGRRDYHWLPGDGNTYFSEITELLPAASAVPFMLEAVHRNPTESPQDFAHRAAAALRHAFAPSTPHREEHSCDKENSSNLCPNGDVAPTLPQ